MADSSGLGLIPPLLVKKFPIKTPGVMFGGLHDSVQHEIEEATFGGLSTVLTQDLCSSLAHQN
jgi:hypothetical protein